MNGLLANTAGMDLSGVQTINNADYLQTELANLRSNIEGLMAIWRGPAATAFNSSYEKQAQNFIAFKDLLNDLGEAIRRGANILNQTEEENASAGARLF